MTDQIPPDEPQYPGQFPPQQPGQFGPPQPGPGQSQPWGGQQQPWQHQPQQPQWGGQQQPWPQQTWPGGQQPPPGGPPPRKSHALRNILILAVPVLLVVLVIIGAIGAATGGHKSGQAGGPAPATTTPVAVTPVTPVLTSAEQKFISDVNSDSAITATASNSALVAIGHDVCTLDKASGNSSAAVSSLQAKMGKASAKEFVKVAQRDLCPVAKPHVIARFSGSGDTTTAPFTIGGSGNWYLRYSYDCSSFGQSGNFIVSEETSDFSGVNVNELGLRAHNKKSYVYNDAGQHHLQVITECSWKVEVVQ